MIATYILVVLSLVAVGSFVLVARFGVSEVRSEKDLDARTVPIDMEIVANLLDSEQIQYVRSRLSDQEFLSFERERAKVLIEYVKRISQNAALLVGFAHYSQAQQRDEARADLYTLALRVRAHSIWMLLLLYCKSIWPKFSIRVDDLFGSYEKVVRSAFTHAAKAS